MKFGKKEFARKGDENCENQIACKEVNGLVNF